MLMPVTSMSAQQAQPAVRFKLDHIGKVDSQHEDAYHVEVCSACEAGSGPRRADAPVSRFREILSP